MNSGDLETREGAPEGGNDREQLATELTRLRQRGIDYVDRKRDRQAPLVLPILGNLAETAVGLGPRNKTLAVYLRQALTAYAVTAAAAAVFIEALYFDTDGGSPGRATASDLLRRARRAEHLSESAFRRLQREHFVEFAEFLLADRSVTSRRRVRSHYAIGFGLAVASIGGMVIWFLR